ncbi:MAG TPA: 5-oxoprolinase subunit PxpB [Candidatus Limnocylindria bacterium]|nr:5-oxoprolinase subunit PxpB [Candidatus Limnocylindria bacterium]
MIRAFGESALLVETGTAERAQVLATAVRSSMADAIAAVPGLESLLVELDPSADLDSASRELERLAGGIDAATVDGRDLTIPVTYGGDAGPDLSEVARLCGMSEEEVIERHLASELRVLFLGFAPGFAYLGGLADELRLPRLATPRTRTPAGSVAIADTMSGIYPADLPGGWRVIGHTDVPLFDPRRDPPALLAPGDRVRFERVDR